MVGPCPCAWESVYVQSHVGYGILTGDGLIKYIQIDANEKQTQSLVENKRFEIKNETEDQGQSIPKSIGTLINSPIVWTNSQAQNGVNFEY